MVQFRLMLRIFLALTINLILLTVIASVQPVAAATAKMGMHVLHKEDVQEVVELLEGQNTDETELWYYITIPYTLEDANKPVEWQAFFNQAKELRVIPIVRLVTEVEGDTWRIPTRKDVVMQLDALSALEWPTSRKRVIIFNEVNHAKEWGGSIDPAEYTRTLRFASLWARSLDSNFLVLPAAMDLAAPNGSQTREAFSYLEAMVAEDPEILTYADAWNSHSYPNPAFSAPPTARGKNSLRGYEHELAFLEKQGITDLPVYITETGWEENARTSKNLTGYYQYALDNIWLPDDRIVAVTPFIFKGSPGPFSQFSFISADGKPTLQHIALSKVLGASATQ